MSLNRHDRQCIELTTKDYSPSCAMYASKACLGPAVLFYSQCTVWVSLIAKNYSNTMYSLFVCKFSLEHECVDAILQVLSGCPWPVYPLE